METEKNSEEVSIGKLNSTFSWQRVKRCFLNLIKKKKALTFYPELHYPIQQLLSHMYVIKLYWLKLKI